MLLAWILKNPYLPRRLKVQPGEPFVACAAGNSKLGSEVFLVFRRLMDKCAACQNSNLGRPTQEAWPNATTLHQHVIAEAWMAPDLYCRSAQLWQDSADEPSGVLALA